MKVLNENEVVKLESKDTTEINLYVKDDVATPKDGEDCTVTCNSDGSLSIGSDTCKEFLVVKMAEEDAYHLLVRDAVNAQWSVSDNKASLIGIVKAEPKPVPAKKDPKKKKAAAKKATAKKEDKPEVPAQTESTESNE